MCLHLLILELNHFYTFVILFMLQNSFWFDQNAEIERNEAIDYSAGDKHTFVKYIVFL